MQSLFHDGLDVTFSQSYIGDSNLVDGTGVEVACAIKNATTSDIEESLISEIGLLSPYFTLIKPQAVVKLLPGETA